MQVLHRHPWKRLCGHVLIILLMVSPVAHAIEEPRFQVERALEPKRIEVRRYEPYVVAEVTVPGPAEQAGNQGFSYLGGYIFGRNKGDRKIAMTAPVTQAAQPVKIEMTAPVAQARSDSGSGYVVQFMMPSSYTLDTLPVPTDPKVRLKEMPGQRVIAIMYTGTWSQGNYDEHLALLKSAAEKAGLKTQGEPVYARYDAPWVPWFMRRNEIWLGVVE